MRDGVLRVEFDAYDINAKFSLPLVDLGEGRQKVDEAIYSMGVDDLNELLGVDGPNACGEAFVEYTREGGRLGLKLKTMEIGRHPRRP